MMTRHIVTMTTDKHHDVAMMMMMMMMMIWWWCLCWWWWLTNTRMMTLWWWLWWWLINTMRLCWCCYWWWCYCWWWSSSWSSSVHCFSIQIFILRHSHLHKFKWWINTVIQVWQRSIAQATPVSSSIYLLLQWYRWHNRMFGICVMMGSQWDHSFLVSGHLLNLKLENS